MIVVWILLLIILLVKLSVFVGWQTNAGDGTAIEISTPLLQEVCHLM